MANLEKMTQMDRMNYKERLKNQIALRDAIERLKQNQDFQLLFKAYTEDNILRLSEMLVHPVTIMSADKQQRVDNITDEIKACAMFKNHLLFTVNQIADMAEKELADINAYEADK